MWVGQLLHCGTIAKNPICDPGGEGRKERRVVIHTLKTIMLTDNVVCIT